ncbi:MAG: SpoIID/LytB domain-containing protein [Pirellulaceae bacterium]|nr:SpoIID/LytB domain-containing protein [Pirellulaceae bacterium]
MIHRRTFVIGFPSKDGGMMSVRRSEVSMLIGLTCTLTLSSCHLPYDGGTRRRSTMLGLDEPTVRVRIRRGVTVVNLDSTGDLIVGPAITAMPRQAFSPPVQVSRLRNGFQVASPTGSRILGQLPSLRITSTTNQAINVDGQAYPGQVSLHAFGDIASLRFDVVNHVPMEQYLPGVLARELYSHWHPAAFRAQAIAARSYAMTELARRRQTFDVESTTVNQVYGGKTQNVKARDAVRATQGVVLTYGGSVLPAYYSSCCGGIGQDASLAFPNGLDVPPLKGRYHGAWCAQSRLYRWGPIRRPTSMLARRIAAWGQAHRNPIAALRGIHRITISDRNRAGRPAQFTVVDNQQGSYTLGPEVFRRACNHQESELAVLPPDQRLHSSDVRVVVGPRNVVFSNGHGHGHGVGMCQYGSEGLARANYTESSILRFFYRGATIERVY